MASNSVSVVALDQPPRAKSSNYPEPFASLMLKRIKRPLGDLFGLTNFGVNLTVLQPGGASSLRHWHSKQDEFVYIVFGQATLHTNEGATEMGAGACAGFKAGNGNAHRLENRSGSPVVYLEIGDRTAGDQVIYPDDDLAIEVIGSDRRLIHKSGEPY
jgi:uncharacterized cupin superfamily protein